MNQAGDVLIFAQEGEIFWRRFLCDISRRCERELESLLRVQTIQQPNDMWRCVCLVLFIPEKEYSPKKTGNSYFSGILLYPRLLPSKLFSTFFFSFRFVPIENYNSFAHVFLATEFVSFRHI